MAHLIIWALATGMVIGAVWVAIVRLKRPERAPGPPRQLPENSPTRSGELENLAQRLEQLEERLDTTEHLLSKRREPRGTEPG